MMITKKKRASSVVYLMSFFIVFLAFCAFAVDATIIFNNRAELQNATEATALYAASKFNSSSSTPTESDIQKAAETFFNGFRLSGLGGLKSATITVEAKPTDKKVRISATNKSPTFFLSFLGVNYIVLEARSCAISEPLNVSASYSGINWITSNAAYQSDIVSTMPDGQEIEDGKPDGNFHNTAILKPIGGYTAASLSAIKTLSGEKTIPAGTPYFSLISSLDNQPLSLGPGGYITIKLPNPIVDKPGADLYIREIGKSLEGYFVFVGIDNDPFYDESTFDTTKGPYKDFDNKGKDISWVNISCTGTPEIIYNGSHSGPTPLGAYNITAGTFGTQTKFYGSGYFDIGQTCSGSIPSFNGVSMAKYLRIIDDNNESAFVRNDDSDGSTDTDYHPAMAYSESSSPTPGADIDLVTVLNHVRLINPKDY